VIGNRSEEVVVLRESECATLQRWKRRRRRQTPLLFQHESELDSHRY
jgi:hypothetical protein